MEDSRCSSYDKSERIEEILVSYVRELVSGTIEEIVAFPCIGGFSRAVCSAECQQNLLHYQTPPLPPALNAALMKSSIIRGGATRQEIELFHLALAASLAALTKNSIMIAAVGILYGRTSLSRLR